MFPLIAYIICNTYACYSQLSDLGNVCFDNYFPSLQYEHNIHDKHLPSPCCLDNLSQYASFFKEITHKFFSSKKHLSESESFHIHICVLIRKHVNASTAQIFRPRQYQIGCGIGIANVPACPTYLATHLCI